MTKPRPGRTREHPVRVSLCVSLAEYRGLRALAAQEGTSVNSLLRTAMSTLLREAIRQGERR
jgi:hypothetical protein